MQLQHAYKNNDNKFLNFTLELNMLDINKEIFNKSDKWRKISKIKGLIPRHNFFNTPMNLEYKDSWSIIEQNFYRDMKKRMDDYTLSSLEVSSIFIFIKHYHASA